MKYRLLAFCLAIVAAACDSRTTRLGPFAPLSPIAPTSTPPPPQPPPPSPERPLPGPGPHIASGETIRGTVQGTDETCFPNWDLTGRCRRFKLDTGSGGTLRVHLKWSAAGDLDLFTVTPDLNWNAAWTGVQEEILEHPVLAGLTYDVLVMSYVPTPPIDFELTAVIDKQ